MIFELFPGPKFCDRTTNGLFELFLIILI